MAEKPSHGFRKAPSVNPSTASAFVGLEATPEPVRPLAAVIAERPEPARIAPPPPPPIAAAPAAAPTQALAPPRRRRKTLVRADGRELRKQTIYFEPELSTRLAVHCAQSGKDISEVVALAVGDFLARHAG